jgi:BirA family biotin operon repressor/biotin-[acetyl-CoA-carboxylase] ligase
VRAAAYAGTPVADLAALLHLPRVVVFESIGSTLDVAHALAGEGAPAGTLVLAEMQTMGRGRLGRSWQSAAGLGLWLTLIERPRDASALDVLALRVGLAVAGALEPLAGRPISLKWPNDVFLGRGKLAGVLVETRWREASVEWVAIGVGINMQHDALPAGAAGLSSDVSRVDALARVVPALRDAARMNGPLSSAELDVFAARDLARGRRCREPVRGIVRGIDAGGALLVETADTVTAMRSGSLVLETDS